MQSRGAFISLEGVDACGKSTLLQKLLTVWAGRGPVLSVREPGGTAVSEQIRAMLLDVRNQGITDRTEALLYAAARAQLVDEQLRPALAAGQLVIADRYMDSTVAYQGAGRGLDRNWLQQLNRLCTGGLTPDLTLLLDIEPELAQARLAAAGAAPDRLEGAGLAFQCRVRQAYRQLQQAEPQRIVLLDAAQSEAAVLEQALAAIGARWPQWGREG